MHVKVNNLPGTARLIGTYLSRNGMVYSGGSLEFALDLEMVEAYEQDGYAQFAIVNYYGLPTLCTIMLKDGQVTLTAS